MTFNLFDHSKRLKMPLDHERLEWWQYSLTPEQQEEDYWQQYRALVRQGVSRQELSLLQKQTYKDLQYNIGIEPLIKQIDAEDGTPLGVLSINRYNAGCLSAPGLFIADVDVYEDHDQQPYRWGQFAIQHDKIRAVAMKYAKLGATFRIYRTFKGFRVLRVDDWQNVGSTATLPMLFEFSADVLYRQICFEQHCYRARLTPKPWRVAAGKTDEHYASTRFVEQIGDRPINQLLRPLLLFHDGISRTDREDLPLA